MRHSSAARLALLGAVAAACGDAAAPAASPAGSYTLVTVNDKPLPQLVARTAAGDVEVVAASLVLRDDASYQSSYTYRVAGSATDAFAQATSGTWAAQGRTVVYTPSGSSPSSVTTMQWDGATLTLADPNGSVPVTLVFRRRT